MPDPGPNNRLSCNIEHNGQGQTLKLVWDTPFLELSSKDQREKDAKLNEIEKRIEDMQSIKQEIKDIRQRMAEGDHGEKVKEELFTCTLVLETHEKELRFLGSSIRSIKPSVKKFERNTLALPIGELCRFEDGERVIVLDGEMFQTQLDVGATKTEYLASGDLNETAILNEVTKDKIQGL